MKHPIARCALCVSLFLLNLAPAMGAGFAIEEQGAASVGRLNAVVAKLGDASTIFYNPAGLGYLSGFNMYVNGQFFFPVFNYTDPEGKRDSVKVTNKVVVIPSVFASYNFGRGGQLSAGLGISAPFGLRLNYPNDWAGAEVIQSVDLQTIFISPTFAWRIHKMVSIGVTLNLIMARVELQRKLRLPDDSGIITGGVALGGRTFTASGNFGIQIRPTKNLFLGLVYKMQAYLKASGNADFDVPAVYKPFLKDQSIKANLFLPDRVDFGIGYQVHPKLYLELDVNWVRWSLFKEVDITFAEPLFGTKSHETIKEKWFDTFAVKLGAEYEVIRNLRLRVGFGYEIDPVPNSTLSPMLPDADRILYSMGIGWVHQKTGIILDVSYLGVIFRPRTVTAAVNHFPQAYRNQAHIIGLSLGYKR